VHDLRDALRSLGSTPIVSAAAVLTLAVGIGANTAIFSILNSLLLAPLPVRDPGTLVAVGSDAPGQDADLMYPVWLALRDRQILDGAFAWADDGLSEVQDGETRPVRVIWVTGRFFDTLGVTAIRGRTLDARDDRRGGEPDGAAAVLSAGFWQRRFGGAPDVVGRTIVLDRVPFTIVGVAQPSFLALEVGARVDVILPLESEPLLQRVPSRLRLWPWLHVTGRVPPAQTSASVAAALRAAQPAIRADTMPDYTSAEDRDGYLKDPWTLHSAASGTSRLRGRYSRALTTLMAIAGLVLLVGCANIANLQLAHAGARRYERSVRAALGASRWRLVRPVLVENALVAAAGTALGLVVAAQAGPLLVAQLATWATVPVLDLSPDARVLAASAGLLTATLLLCGAAPSVLAGSAAPIDALKHGAAASGTRGLLRSGELLVTLQIAVCVLLLVGAGLFIRSFAALVYRDLGFDRRPVMVAAIDAQRSRVPPPGRLPLFERLRQQAAGVPGVAHTALSMATPLGNAGVRLTPRVALSAADVAAEAAPRVLTHLVSPEWFDTYGTRLRAGRAFSDRDTAASAPVAIVNEAFARRFFRGESPLGRTFSTTAPGTEADDAVTPEIVGVVEDAAFTSVRNAVEPTAYRPFAQSAGDVLHSMPTVCLSVRAAPGASAEALRGAVASALAGIDSEVSVSTVTVTAQLDAYYVRERLLGLLAGFFAVLGLALAAIGLYGVTAQSVARRTREVGIRMALGADDRRVTRLILRRLAIVSALGTAMGVAASLVAGRVIESLLFGVTARDPLAFALALVTLSVTCAIAGWLPARRAARTEPMIVLRES
jgi:predicted permease